MTKTAQTNQWQRNLLSANMTSAHLLSGDMRLETFRVPCLVCKKMLAFTSVSRHMKTVHQEKIGKIWGCVECGKILQNEKRLTQHQTLHNPQSENPSLFYCQDCNDKTKCKDYLVDHRRLMHNQTGNGQYICIAGKCSTKPSSFPNQPRLDKHKTNHASEKCTECGKIFGAKRNLRRHEKKKHQKDQVDLSVNSNHSEGDANENAIPDALGDALNVDMIIVTK